MKNFFRKKLKNGLTVIGEKRDLPIVSLCIANPIGGAYEDSEIKGISHVLEHMLFTGTKTRTHEDISREIEKKGGILNAYTANEVTNFWFKLPSEHLFAGLEIFTDMMNNSVLKEEKFEKEKKVILEEIKMKHDDPAGNLYDKMESCLYEKPFADNIIGNEKTVSSLTRDYVYKFYKENYNPENFIVVLVGDFDFGKVCRYFEKKFKKGKGKLEKKTIIPINKNYYEERQGIDQSHFMVGMHAPLVNDKDFPVLEVLNSYIGDGMSSKLFLKIREEKGLAYSVRGHIINEKSYAFYVIYAGTRKEVIKEVEKMIVEEFQNIDKMTKKEFEDAKQQIIGTKHIFSESGDRVMDRLLHAELANKAEDYYTYENKIKKVKIEDVKRLAKQLIKKYSTAAIVPKG